MRHTILRFFDVKNCSLGIGGGKNRMMKDYLGWKYGYQQKGTSIGFEVKPNKPYNKPDTFFKYYALTQNSVDALTKLYVYASHPEQLNDPFDCDRNLAEIQDDKNAKKLWEGLYETQKQRYVDNNEDFFEYSTELFSILMFRKWGVLSLTESYKDIKMWALYTQNKGFCLEWDINLFPFACKGPFPIHYVEKLKKASSTEYDVPTLALIQCNVKQKCWEDEKEWRLMIQNPIGVDIQSFGYGAEQFNQFPEIHDRKFKYPLSALKTIFLGIDFGNY